MKTNELHYNKNFHWEGLPNNLDLNQYKGFVYMITNTKTQKKYIGKKFFWHTKRIKVKGRKNRKKQIKESDWRYYKSSSSDLKNDIKYLGIKNFKFEVLILCKTEKELTFEETRQLFINNVLSSKLPENKEFEFYNDNILGKFFRKDDPRNR